MEVSSYNITNSVSREFQACQPLNRGQLSKLVVKYKLAMCSVANFVAFHKSKLIMEVPNRRDLRRLREAEISSSFPSPWR